MKDVVSKDNSNPATTVALAIGAAARLATITTHAVEREQARLSGIESMNRSRREGLLTTASDARAFERLVRRLIPISFLANRILRNSKQEADKASLDATHLLVASERLRKRIENLNTLLKRLQHAEKVLAGALNSIHRFGVPPKRIEDRAKTVGGMCSGLASRRRDVEWAQKSTDACTDAVIILRDWARIKLKIQEEQRIPARPSVLKKPVRRIYLPIPSVLTSSAKQAGAKRDDVTYRGISPWYVTTDMDLTPFRGMLPLAYRQQSTRFEFPPIPYRATGQNLWSFFDKDTWRRIRSASTASTGNRCMICGGRGGYIAEKVLTPEEKRFGVDCHEVWEWDSHDPGNGIGVQSLKRILVVCPSCHSCFHKGYFVHRGQEVGLSDEVSDFIDKRRMQINRVDAAELAEAVAASKEKLQSLQGIDQWVIDLKHIGQQQFLTDHTPILDERNRAGVPPERIAGIAFETISGESFPSRSAGEILEELSRIEDDRVTDPGMR